MSKSSIEWTQETWNPTVGCARISPGCANCYAKTLHDKRHKAFLAGKKVAPQYAQPFEVLQMIEERVDAPLRWREPRLVFVNSVSDLFHEDVPEDFIARVFAVMAFARQHTFQVLTKRAERMKTLLGLDAFREEVDTWITMMLDDEDRPPALRWDSLDRRTDDANATAPDVYGANGWPLRNVWLGVSVENQHFADERIPLLLQTPAAIRFISAEPLLGPVDLEAVPIPVPGADVYGLRGVAQPLAEKDSEPDDWKYWTRKEAKLGWVIVGGESGIGARPFDIAWARSIVAQCKAAGVPVFVKQLGSLPVQDEAEWRAGDGTGRVSMLSASNHRRTPSGFVPIAQASRKGGEPVEWPEDLRVREMPAARA